MSEPTRIRAQAADGVTTVRMLLSHEMETGQRKDASGKTVPAWHIQDVEVTLNGKVVFTAECGTAVSKNPFFLFTLKGGRAGEKLAVRWRDSRGETRVDEALVL